jgi:hypothetical protein
MNKLVVVAEAVLWKIDRKALTQQGTVNKDAAIALAVRARTAGIAHTLMPMMSAELIRPVACRSAHGFDHTTRLAMVHFQTILPARAIRILGADLEANIRITDTRIAFPAAVAIPPHSITVRLRADVVHDNTHCRATNRAVRAHAVVEADQRHAADERTRVAYRVLWAVAVPGAVDTAEIQIHANAPVVVVALVPFIAQSEGAALVVFAVTLEIGGIRVNHVSGVPTSTSPVAPLLALGLIENACILAALPALHAGATSTAAAVARALVALGNTGILTTFPAFLTRAFTIFNLILTGTTDDQ